MTSNTEKPIEDLLDEVDAQLETLPYRVDNSAIRRLSKELRQRIEKEKQVSDVQAALIELREMSPEPHLGRVFVTQKFCYSTEDNGAFEVWNIEGRIFGDSPFVGRTLEEAMQEIRQWKEESK